MPEHTYLKKWYQFGALSEVYQLRGKFMSFYSPITGQCTTKFYKKVPFCTAISDYTLININAAYSLITSKICRGLIIIGFTKHDGKL